MYRKRNEKREARQPGRAARKPTGSATIVGGMDVPSCSSTLPQKIAKVHVRGKPRSQSGWIAYHESQDPLTLVEHSRYVGYSSKSSSVSFVIRYDWGYHMPDIGNIPRPWADIDPESGWKT